MTDIEILYEKYGESRIKKYNDLLEFASDILTIGFKDQCDWEFDEEVKLIFGFRFADGLTMHKTMLIGIKESDTENDNKDICG